VIEPKRNRKRRWCKDNSSLNLFVKYGSIGPRKSYLCHWAV